MKDAEYIEALSIPERANLKANTRIPKLSYFLQSTVEALEERERAAVKQHREQGSKPPWYDDDQGATERKAVKYGRCYYRDCSEPTLSGIYCCCDDAQQHRDKVSEWASIGSNRLPRISSSRTGGWRTKVGSPAMSPKYRQRLGAPRHGTRF